MRLIALTLSVFYLVLTVGRAAVLLEWPDVSNEIGYVVERTAEMGIWSQIAVIPANRTEFRDESAPDGVTHRYRVRSVGPGGVSIPTPEIRVTILTGKPASLLNISARAVVRTDEGTLIAGFVLERRARVLVRGIGPGLAQFGVFGALPETQIAVYRGPENLFSDFGFPPEAIAASTRAGAFPMVAGDSATVLDLNAGVYTLHVFSPTGLTGTALVEVYLLDN